MQATTSCRGKRYSLTRGPNKIKNTIITMIMVAMYVRPRVSEHMHHNKVPIIY